MKIIKKDSSLIVLTVIRDYMFTNAYFKLSIVPFVLLSYYAFKLHVNIIESVTLLEGYMISNSKTISLEKIVLLHVMFLFAHYLYTFMYTALITFFVINNFTVAFKKFTRQYLSIKYANFHQIGTGKIRSLIERRSCAITSIARILMANIYIGLSYAITNNYVLYKKFGSRIMLWNTLLYVVFVLFYLVLSRYIKVLRNRTNETYTAVSKRTFEINSNYDIIKTYNSDELELKKLNKDLEKDQRASFEFNMVLLMCKWGQRNLIIILNALAICLITYGLGFEELNNHAAISFYNKLFLSTLDKFESIGNCIPYFIEQSAIFEYTCLEGCEAEDFSDTGFPVNFENEIRFVNFGLQVDGVRLIQDSTFTVKKGEKVAIYGRNGCGKSSLMKVLLGFIEYDGEIYIDEKNLRDIPLYEQRCLFAYVPQNPHIIEGTVLENLKYGNINITDEQVYGLCQTYKTHEIFRRFENGYTTNVGESGKFLSGGQKQQISFMRSIIKDSDFYLIDEPTSNLDVSAEIEMLDSILTKKFDKTVLAILHNPKLLCRFDKFLIVKDSKVTAYNSFEECRNEF